MTKFFKVINVSATHIYHSALDLSPLLSIIRKFYYHQRPTPLPRVAVGIPDSWDPSISISTSGFPQPSLTWSPCGQFVAMRTEGAVEIRNALTLELLSTLRPAEPASRLMGTIAYSPDGHSLCHVFDTTIVIWDIQTGGVIREIQSDKTYNVPPVWSLDGRLIGTMFGTQGHDTWAVRRYNVASGTALLPTTFRSQCQPHLWALENSFRVMTTARNGETHTFDISEVGPALTKIVSFSIQLGKRDWWIESFSPATYRISISVNRGSRLLILDIRDSRKLLEDYIWVSSHSFSSDGGLFAASWWGCVRTWEYYDGRYTPWRQFSFPKLQRHHSLLQFSPTPSSILAHSSDTLRLWRFDGPPLPPLLPSNLTSFLTLVLTSWLPTAGGAPSQSPTSSHESLPSSSTQV